MLAKAGNTVTTCSAVRTSPGSTSSAAKSPPPPPYSPLANNCSGKHSGMLAYCVQCGLPKETYLDYDHPLQQAIRRAVAHFTSTPEADLVAGIDGCSAPNYAVPLAGLALAFARLRRGTMTPSSVGAAGPGRCHDRASRNGVGRGPQRSRADARGARDWVAKIGAEGVQGIGVRGAGIGIAIKVADGNKRALRPIMAAVLDQLGLLDARRRADLDRWFEPVLRNHRGIVTGRVVSSLVLDKFSRASFTDAAVSQ
jgi:L-asparaginase II